MSEITLQELIDKVKDDLITSKTPSGYPIFFIDQVELEVMVNITSEAAGGLSVKILDIGGELGGKLGSESSHKIKITLTPILSREEQRTLIDEDSRLFAGVKKATQAILRKSGNTGEPMKE